MSILCENTVPPPKVSTVEARALLAPLVRAALDRMPAGQAARARTCNPTCFLNAAACRDLAVETATALRPHSHLDRVSQSFLVEVNEVVRRFIIDRVKRHPSKGHTIK